MWSPRWWTPVSRRPPCPANYNLITCTAERVGRQSFFGQGAGRFPTASNVVQDCLTILSGDKSFYTGKADTAQLDGSAEAHPYYVRTAAPDDFLRSVTADHWGAGVVTSAVNTYAMLAWARRQLAADLPASSPVSAELLHHAKRGLRCGSLSPFKEIFMIRSNIPPFFVVGYHAA